MGKYSRKWLLASPAMLVVLLLLFVAAGRARGQWKIVAPNLFTGTGATNPSADGAMHVKDGIIWAGGPVGMLEPASLWRSTDTGKSWQPTSYLGNVHDINFFDSQYGVIGSAEGIYLTTDGGQTWKNILGRTSGGNSINVSSVAFGSSPSFIYTLTWNSGMFVSTDMGTSWQTVFFGQLTTLAGMCLTIGKDGTIYVLAISNNPPAAKYNPGWIASSTDAGQTWTYKAGPVNGDSYALTADSCDARRFYLANEDYYDPSDNFSHIFVTQDAGASWQETFKDTLGVVAGNISATSQAEYAGTMDSIGVLRSVNDGQTWTRIGGPAISVDSRNLVAFNDNIVFGVDQSGNVWGTYNSGDDSILAPSGPFAVTPLSLFATDTVHCDSITRSITLSAGGCNAASLLSSWITGADMEAFSEGTRSGDIIPVIFHGTRSGDYHAKLIFQISNGTFDTIALGGYAVGAQPLNFITANVKTDTLGATVAVPITITGLKHAEDVDLVLHYDGSVDYLGSFSPSGARLDIPGDSSAWRSKLHIVGAMPGIVAGYAKFNAWNDSNAAAHATFDSMSVLTAISPCEYSLPEAATSTITAPAGCGTTMLSRWVHLGEQPKFVIQPNPTEGDVSISSSLDLGEATIAIYDMLGAERSRWQVNITTNAPITLPLPEANGVYTIVVQAAAGTYNLRVVRHR